MDTNVITTLDGFTERELNEIIFCRTYVAKFNHGTDGHNRMVVVTKLYELVKRHLKENAILKAEVAQS